jgi:dTDP-4-amino-4,6-dideoxygalactose transaminase
VLEIFGSMFERANLVPDYRSPITDQDVAAVAALQKNARYGSAVYDLENALSKMFGGAEAVVVSSETAALYLSLAALGCSSGKEVIVPSYSRNGVYAAVSHTGASAKCADCLPTTPVMSACDGVSEVKTGNTRAVVVAHQLGFRADIKSIQENLKLPVIEECSHVLGGVDHNGNLLGLEGSVGILSFAQGATLSAGEGGACITRNSSIARTVRDLRNCEGRLPDPRGFNFKMSEVTAAVIRARLNELSAANAIREEIAAAYDEVFGESALRAVSPIPQAICHTYALRLQNNLEKFIQSAHYEAIVCKRPVWRPLHYSLGGFCPNTERLHEQLVALPLFPELSEEELSRVCALGDLLNEF